MPTKVKDNAYHQRYRPGEFIANNDSQRPMPCNSGFVGGMPAANGHSPRVEETARFETKMARFGYTWDAMQASRLGDRKRRRLLYLGVGVMDRANSLNCQDLRFLLKAGR